MDTTTQKINFLYDSSQIKQVLFTYATACDSRNWKLLEEVFGSDVKVNELGTRDVLGPE